MQKNIFKKAIAFCVCFAMSTGLIGYIPSVYAVSAKNSDAFLQGDLNNDAAVTGEGQADSSDLKVLKQYIFGEVTEFTAPNIEDTLDLTDMPVEYTESLNWVWENRIIKEGSTTRQNLIFDQIYAGNGTLNYVVRWQSLLYL